MLRREPEALHEVELLDIALPVAGLPAAGWLRPETPATIHLLRMRSLEAARKMGAVKRPETAGMRMGARWT